MKKNLFRFSSRRILFSTVIASALLAGGSQTVFADAGEVQAVLQAGAIKGKIVDSNGEPVIGANVKVKGTTNGTITDIDGNFALNNVSGGTLTISFIGYKTLEIPVKGTNLARIVMHEDTEVLDEVVVVGYGTMKKESLTGSVAVVSGDIFKDKGTVSNPLQAMQGQVPGVRITRSSAAPGEEGWGISVRGAVSKNSTSPLIIVDGVEGDITHINPADIESINFLKDASAAIYGSKAAGGVVLVATKKASKGKAKIEYDGSYTYKIVGLQPRLMSLDQWTDGLIQARLNDGKTEEDNWIRYARLAKANKGGYISLANNPNPIPGYFTDIDDYVFHDVNWTDELWGNSYSTQHSLGVSGGNDKVTYRLSFGYLRDDGTFRWGENNNEKFTLRASNVYNVTDKFVIESVISAARQNQIAPTQLSGALTVSMPQPGLPISTIDGKQYAWGGWGAPNWKAKLGGDNKLIVTILNVNETFRYKVLDGLDVNATLGYATNSATRDEQYLSINWYNYEGKPITGKNASSPTQAESSYKKGTQRTDNYSASVYLNYTKAIKEDHNFKLMLGGQYDRAEFDQSFTTAKDIQSSLEVINGNGQITLGDKARWQEAIMSYFSRVNYNYKSKYLFEVNARYDGTSKFQPENRWDFFYGLSGGWRIIEESFAQGIKKYVDDLKIRASYGQVGNQSGVSRYDGIQLYNYNSNSGAYIGDGKLSTIAADGTLVSYERGWERIHNYSLGLDFLALNGRLSGSFELFLKKNDNMLVSKKYPDLLGGNAPLANGGKFEGRGYEGVISWKDKVGSVTYNIGGTLTFMKNKLISGGDDVINPGYNANVNGYPLNSVFGYRYAGKIQNEEQLELYKKAYLGGNSLGMPTDLRLGDNMFEDVNKDGRIDVEDLVYLGTDDPEISFSFNFGAEWNGFDFSVIFQGVGNRTIFRPSDVWKVPFKSSYLNTTTQSIGNVWSLENPNAKYPTYSNENKYNNYNYIASSWSVDDGTYLRLKNIVLGYTLPKSLLAKTKGAISNVRIYIAGADLWETAKISDGWDPEATRKIENKQRYPFNRTITGGLNVTF